MDSARLDELVQEKLKKMCEELAVEVGSPPMGSFLIVEWVNTNGSVAVSLPGAMERSSLLRIVDSLGRKSANALQRIKSQINRVPAQKTDS